jgi:hypothetical protein
MDESTRRAWTRPEMIVLVRGGPEEAVLTTCKNEAGGGLPAADEQGCQVAGRLCDLACNAELES